MQVITKIRIALVALAVVLFFGGLHSAIKPSHIVVVRAGEPGMPGTTGASVEFVVSKSSRWFGIIRLILGTVLGWYAVKPAFARGSLAKGNPRDVKLGSQTPGG